MTTLLSVLDMLVSPKWRVKLSRDCPFKNLNGSPLMGDYHHGINGPQVQKVKTQNGPIGVTVHYTLQYIHYTVTIIFYSKFLAIRI